jgi:hypothetical protein
MPQFQSYYWTDAKLSSTATRHVGTLADPSSSEEAIVTAFTALLGADDTVTRCVGMDWYSFTRSQARHGGDEEAQLAALSPDVRRVALEELAKPPSTVQGAAVNGANHGSAFTALGYVAKRSDADAIARALDLNDEPSVLSAGTFAATGMVHRQAAMPPTLAAALDRVVQQENLPVRTRIGALETAALSKDPVVVRWLLAALEASDVEMSAAAARQLLRRDMAAHRHRVATVAATWPSGSDLPWAVVEVRRLLDDPE